MDTYMDIDSEDILEEDPVCTFLTQRLKDIRDSNQQLRTTIEHSRRAMAEVTAAGGGAGGGLIAGGVTKRFHNGKWCFIAGVASSDPTITYSNFDVVLKWSPIISVQHTLMTYSDDAKSFATSAQIARELRVIVALESIAFAAADAYVAHAVLLYDAANANANRAAPACRRRRHALLLGAFDVSAAAANGGAHAIKSAHLISGERAALLAAIACSAQITLAAALPRGALQDYLVVDGMCRQLEFDGRVYFLLSADVQHLDGCLMECAQDDGVELITLFVRDGDHLRNVVRHLHASIKGVSIVPLRCKSLLQKSQRAEEDPIFSSQDCLQSQQPAPIDGRVRKFGECLLQQIDSVIDFHRNVAGNASIPGESDVSEEYLGMRDLLTQLEDTTDFYHQQFIAEVNS